MEDIVCRIGILRMQEKKYRCNDYLGRLNSQLKENSSKIFDNRLASSGKVLHQINEDCREKMINWFFRVADHFNVKRELVVISTNYLDRFLSKYDCDRTSFKLAALTALYMTAKIHGNCNHSPIPLKILVHLSDGEFSVENVANMERVILPALNWSMYPPTTTEFVYLYMRVLTLQSIENSSEYIHKYALHVSELAVSDYFFVTYEPSTIAIAAIINSLEHEKVSFNVCSEFLRNITCIHGNFDQRFFDSQESLSCNVNDARKRLLELELHIQKPNFKKRDVSSSKKIKTARDAKIVLQDFNPKVESTKVKSISPTCISRC